MEKENKEERSLVWKVIKGLMITNIITLFLWFATIGGFIWYIQLYDYIGTTTTTIDGTDGGNANYIKGNGDIINGEDSRSFNKKEN